MRWLLMIAVLGLLGACGEAEAPAPSAEPEPEPAPTTHTQEAEDRTQDLEALGAPGNAARRALEVNEEHNRRLEEALEESAQAD